MEPNSKSKVYFTKEISSEKIIELFKDLNKELPGKIAIKVHSGEKGNKNFLHPEFLRPIVDYLQGTVVECNTAYENMRHTTELHKELLETHNWTNYRVEILDEDGEKEGTKNPDKEFCEELSHDKPRKV